MSINFYEGGILKTLIKPRTIEGLHIWNYYKKFLISGEVFEGLLVIYNFLRDLYEAY